MALCGDFELFRTRWYACRDTRESLCYPSQHSVHQSCYVSTSLLVIVNCSRQYEIVCRPGNSTNLLLITLLPTLARLEICDLRPKL